MTTAKAPPVKAPTDRASTMLMGVGGGLAALSLVTGGMLAPLGVAFGAFIGVVGLRQRAYGRAIVRTHAALQAITRGQFEEAEQHLDAMPAWVTKKGSGMRAAVYQRALIAFYRNDPKQAAAILEPAMRTQTRLATRNYEHMQRSIALSLRALAYASMGEADRARADIADVAQSLHATPESLARSRLAEAVLLARAGEMDALAAHLRAHSSLILEYAFPRERVLARALRKMVQSRSRSIYREAARPEEEAADAGAIGAWIATIAPEAAAHATEGARLADRAEVAPPAIADVQDVRAVHEARARAAKQTKRPIVGQRRFTLALWAALVVMFLVIYQLLATDDAERAARHARHARDATPAAEPLLTASSLLTTTAIGLPLIFVAVLVAVVVAQTRRVRKAERDVLAAQRAIALGDLAAAEPLLVALENSGRGLGPAQALYLRARHAEQEARFDDCIALCDRALASIGAQVETHRMLASMVLTPAVIGLRGVALAAVGRIGEGTAELATIARDHATWSHRASAELRIRLMLAVRRGDLDAARSIARERTPELPITIRDEALADLVLATAPSGASRDEQERVDTELREDMTVRSWIDAIAPDLREDLARRVSSKGVRIDSGDPDKSAEIQADETDEDSESEAAFLRA